MGLCLVTTFLVPAQLDLAQKLNTCMPISCNITFEAGMSRDAGVDSMCSHETDWADGGSGPELQTWHSMPLHGASGSTTVSVTRRLVCAAT